MILLRPADPTRPIEVRNAIGVELESVPPGWLLDEISYVIESADVEVSDE